MASMITAIVVLFVATLPVAAGGITGKVVITRTLTRDGRQFNASGVGLDAQWARSRWAVSGEWQRLR